MAPIGFAALLGSLLYLIPRGLAALDRASKLGRAPGPYSLQAAIAACAMAVSMAFGPAAGLEIVDQLRDEPSLAGYHRLPSVRDDLLFKLGRLLEARIAECLDTRMGS